MEEDAIENDENNQQVQLDQTDKTDEMNEENNAIQMRNTNRLSISTILPTNDNNDISIHLQDLNNSNDINSIKNNVEFFLSLNFDNYPLLKQYEIQTDEIISKQFKNCVIPDNDVLKDHLNELENNISNDNIFDENNEVDLENEIPDQNYKRNDLILYFNEKNRFNEIRRIYKGPN